MMAGVSVGLCSTQVTSHKSVVTSNKSEVAGPAHLEGHEGDDGGSLLGFPSDAAHPHRTPHRVLPEPLAVEGPDVQELLRRRDEGDTKGGPR